MAAEGGTARGSRGAERSDGGPEGRLRRPRGRNPRMTRPLARRRRPSGMRPKKINNITPSGILCLPVDFKKTERVEGSKMSAVGTSG